MRLRKRAFTLLELIVVLVILGLLAAIAIPTYQSVIGESQNRKTSTTLAAITRDAHALKALDPSMSWVDAFNTAAGEAAAADSVGLSAAGTWTAVAATDKDSLSSSPTEIVVWVADEAVGPLLSVGDVSAVVRGVDLTSCHSAIVSNAIIPAFCDNAGEVSAVAPNTNTVATTTTTGSTTTTTTAPQTVVPAAPTGLTAVATSGQVTLSWTPVASTANSPVDGYHVYLQGSVVPEKTAPSAGCTATACVITGLTDGTSYSYQVTAFNSAGNSPKSAAATVTPIAAPDAPTGVVVTAGNAQATVAWNPVAATAGKPVDGYRILPDGDSDLSNFGLGDLAPSICTTTCTQLITGLTNNLNYGFRVVAFNAAGSTSAAPAFGTPLSPLTMNYAATQFSYASTNQSLNPTVSGGSGALTYSVASGTLPAGVTLNATTGALVGPTSWDAGFTKLELGGSSGCGVTSAGGVRCWGSNSNGELGVPTTTAESLSGVTPTGLGAGVTDVAVSKLGSFACAVQSGAVKCWGYSEHGKVGQTVGTTGTVATPTSILGVASGVTDVAVGQSHACAVQNGNVLCWGRNNKGQLGIGSTANQNTAQAVNIGSGNTAVKVALSSTSTCALLTTGTVRCWGDNANGEVAGLATATTSSGTPYSANSLSGIADVVAGNAFFCGRSSTNTVQCWGSNTVGQFGNGTTAAASSTPVTVAAYSGATSITALGGATCAVLSGAAKCAGSGTSGQLGNGAATTSSSLVSVTGLSSGVAFVAGGFTDGCAVLTTGATKCWGGNGSGQLGNGNKTQQNAPANSLVKRDLASTTVTIQVTDGATTVSQVLTVSAA